MCPTNSNTRVCGRSIEQVHRQLRLHPDCRKQQHIHLVETGAQIQSVKTWKLKGLHDRLYLNGLDEMGKSIVLPKIHDSTCRLLRKLVKEGVLETEMTPLGSKVVYPDWTKTWTWTGWNGDITKEAGEAMLAQAKRPKRAKRGTGGRSLVPESSSKQAQTLLGDIESLALENASLIAAEEQRASALSDFYKLRSGRPNAYKSSIRRLLSLDRRQHQIKIGLDQQAGQIYSQFHELIVAN